MDMPKSSGESAANKFNPLKRMDVRSPLLWLHLITAGLLAVITVQIAQLTAQSAAQNSQLVAALTEKAWPASPSAQQAPTAAPAQTGEPDGPLQKEGPYLLMFHTTRQNQKPRERPHPPTFLPPQKTHHWHH